jgi:hypothetical protein
MQYTCCQDTFGENDADMEAVCCTYKHTTNPKDVIYGDGAHNLSPEDGGGNDSEGAIYISDSEAEE